MDVFVFEWCVGGGLLGDSFAPDSLLHEGRAMRDAIATDFAKAGHHVVSCQDARIPVDSNAPFEPFAVSENSELKKSVCKLAKQADRILLIAPETQGCLLRVVNWVEPWKFKLISPGHEFVRIAGDKNLTRQRLIEHGISMPAGVYVERWSEFDGSVFAEPIVIKPVDGCGSEQVRLVEQSNIVDFNRPEPAIVEQYVPGTPVSISAVAQPVSFYLLPPVEQIFSEKPIGAYVDCRYPLSLDEQTRATRLAGQVLEAMPATRGYVGIDLVLSDLGPEQDVVIEVNPRLTSSYLKLREVSHVSIAELMLA